MTDELKSGIQAAIDAYRERSTNPPKPGPLIVPRWLPDAWARQHPNDDLETICRSYGFDGYTTEIG